MDTGVENQAETLLGKGPRHGRNDLVESSIQLNGDLF